MKLEEVEALKTSMRAGEVDAMTLDRLEEELRAAREAYYNLNPVLSDQVYDAKRDLLKSLRPGATEATTVGATPLRVSVWEKVEHQIPMGSLDKVNTEEEFLEWATSTGTSEFVFTYKMDGSSMELVYQEGKLIRCVTRGDGKVGEDVTFNVSQIPNVPKTIPIATEEVIVRGEVVMLKQVFQEKYAGEYANPRNTANGKVREKSGGGKDCENLVFYAFRLISKSAPRDEAKRMAVLGKMGFSTPDYALGDAETAAKWHQSTVLVRDNIPYEIDGTVMYVNDIALQDGLGEVHMRPRGQIAYKFDSAKGITRVLDIKWQVGNSGRITPVASVAPVEIGGVTITSISLHNLTMFRELKLFQGCEVLVSRRNDVIPYIEENLSSPKEPS